MNLIEIEGKFYQEIETQQPKPKRLKNKTRKPDKKKLGTNDYLFFFIVIGCVIIYWAYTLVFIVPPTK